MITAEDVKKRARALGADVVKIGNIERWDGAPPQMDPRQIMPEAKSIIGMLFRINRGSLRGIEEGTFFSNYSAMGYGAITYVYQPMVVITLTKDIEDVGYEAIPYGHQSEWRAINNDGSLRDRYSRPVTPDRPHPDVMVHLRMAAFLCGLGEIGYSKIFLSPQFGPRNRIGIVITDAPLEPDPIYEGPQLCDRCMACVRDCPAQAIPPDRTVKVTAAGHDLEWADIDLNACGPQFTGRVPTKEVLAEENQYIPPNGDTYYSRGFWTPFYHQPPLLYKQGSAICGGRGCIRACMIQLEARGVLENKFHDKFRRRKPWTVDWTTEDELGPGAKGYKGPGKGDFI
ncbi:MAG: hypothetical protein GXY76_18840 [Chloroflexi bacterium]|nr:hypothetical protein [Chloroflexota bacterium]